MGLSEAANLVINMTLKDHASATIKTVQGKLKGLGGQLSVLKVAAGTALGNAFTSMGRLAISGVKKVFGAIEGGIESLATLEDATTSVDGAIKQMGLTGKVTSKQIAGWANDIESSVQAAFDDKDIVAATTTLIRYGKIVPGNLKPAMVVMTDLAAKTGSVESASELLAKALAAPEKAAGKLARTGVILTDAQQGMIEEMVKAGDTAGAQTVLLDALTEATKGAAAASKGPFRDAQNTLKDVIEDVQRALATGFLPVIQEISTYLKGKLADPAFLKKVEEFGKTLAGALHSALEAAKNIPWKSIGDAMKLAGQGAKAAYDMFMGMPDWVKTAVITGWGLNKLTGGALGGIVGELGKGLIKGVLGMNAAVVNINAGAVNGGGGLPGGAGAAGGGGLMGALGWAVAPVTIGALSALAIDQFGASQKSALDQSLKEHPLTVPDKGILSDSGLASAMAMFGKNTLLGETFATALGPNFKAEINELGDIGADAAKTKTNTDPLGSLLTTIARTIGLQPTPTQDPIVTLAHHIDSERKDNNAALANLAATVKPPLDNISAATSGALTSLNGRIEVTAPELTPLLAQTVTGQGKFAMDFAAKWGALRDTLVAQGVHGEALRQAIMKGLGINHAKLDRMTTIMRSEVAAKLGITVSELRHIKRGADQNEEKIAAKLGISVEKLRELRGAAREHAALQMKTNEKLATANAKLEAIKNKNWTVKIATAREQGSFGGINPATGRPWGRASGGSVVAGRTYDVGERGRERLTMFRDGGGYVTPLTKERTFIDRIPTELKRLSSDFATKWGQLRDQLVAQGREGASLRRGITSGLGISAGRLDHLTRVMRKEVAEELGVTVKELRTIKRGADQNEKLIAEQLGITVQHLRAIRERGREAAAQGGRIRLPAGGVSQQPVIHNRVFVTLSAREVARSLNREATLTYARSR